jgi:hypothetical protein
MRATPLIHAPSSVAATSAAHSRSPMAGARPRFPPMCMTAQTRSVPDPSCPSCHSREIRRLTPANLPACRSGRVRPAPELLIRSQLRRYYAVRPIQPFQFILRTATNSLTISSGPDRHSRFRLDHRDNLRHSPIRLQPILMLIGIGHNDHWSAPVSPTSFSSPALIVESDPTIAARSLLSTAARSWWSCHRGSMESTGGNNSTG